MTPWTPGPWIAEKASDTDNTWAVKAEAAQAYFVAEVFEIPDGAEIEANARLIAAAPELYAALQMLEAAYGDRTWGTVEAMARAMPTARAALAKATAA